MWVGEREGRRERERGGGGRKLNNKHQREWAYAHFDIKGILAKTRMAYFFCKIIRCTIWHLHKLRFLFCSIITFCCFAVCLSSALSFSPSLLPPLPVSLSLSPCPPPPPPPLPALCVSVCHTLSLSHSQSQSLPFVSLAVCFSPCLHADHFTLH